MVECRIEDVEESYRAKYSDILAIKRGFGLWLWKPYLIKKTALEANENDIIFYCDSGTFFVNPVFELCFLAGSNLSFAKLTSIFAI